MWVIRSTSRPFNFSRLAALMLILIGLLGTGCAQTRTVTITTKPADAMIRINGVERGRGPITETFKFDASITVYRIVVYRLGFQPATKVVDRTFAGDTLHVALLPKTRNIEVTVTPAKAILSIDGVQETPAEVDTFTKELAFTVDAKNNWTTHTITAERANFLPATQLVTIQDDPPVYNLELQPLRKDLKITTNPPGADVYVDDKPIGASPVTDGARAFPFDVTTNQFATHRIKASKKGYETATRDVSWDEGSPDYTLELTPKKKTVRIMSDPPGASVVLDGQTLPTDSTGAATATLSFAPRDGKDELPTYKGVATKKPEHGDEWYPAEFAIAWDDNKSNYTIPLKEILTRQVPMLTAAWSRDQNAWQVEPKVVSTLAMKDTSEGEARAAPVLIARAPPGGTIDSLTVSPDGRQLLYTVLTGNDPKDFRSQFYTINADGSGAPTLFLDAKSLDLMPAYTPGGDKIVFSSNRAGQRLSVWEMNSSGVPITTQLTTGETNDLWPSVDSEPEARQRLYFQSLVDRRGDPRLFSARRNTPGRTDMTGSGGTQPRVSPRNDVVLFAAVNEKTGKRDLFRVPTIGGAAQNLTNTPEVDEFDGAWSPEGSRVAYAADASTDPVEKNRNLDIWIADLGKLNQPIQLTKNGSQDDCPVWDPIGRNIYFRSNRGGEWGIWKISLK